MKEHWLSMSQSSVADNAYTLFSDFSMGDFPNGTGYTGPYGNKNALTFNNPTWTGNQIVSQVNANNPLGINWRFRYGSLFGLYSFSW